MMLSGCYNLLLGNILIGVWEGLLVSWAFKVPRKRTIYLMIAGNYASMIVGMILIMAMGGYSALGWDSDVYAVRRQVALGAAASLGATLVVEWPFFILALKSCSRRLGKSVLANVLAQVASYAVLIPVAVAMGQFGVLTDVRIDPNVVSEAGEDATIFYTLPREDAVYRIRLNGTKREKIAALDRSKGWGNLCLMQEAATGKWNVCVDLDREVEVLLRDVALPMVPDVVQDANRPFSHMIVPRAVDKPIDYRPIAQRHWQVEMDWLNLIARDTKTGQEIRVGLDTQFATWLLNYPTVLPGDRVVFVANRQILLLDLNTRRLGAIAKGWEPIVIPNLRRTHDPQAPRGN